jgi:Zn-dependent protease with chaperone function
VIGEDLKGLWRRVKIGFWKRITICLVVVISVSLFNAITYPVLRLAAVIGTSVAAGLMFLSYFPLYFGQLRLILRNRATEVPLPDEIVSLARTMGLKIKKMKLIPKICNAYIRGGQLFVGEGLLAKLNLDQFRAVAAHEFGHMKGKHATVVLLFMLPILLYVSLIWQDLPQSCYIWVLLLTRPSLRCPFNGSLRKEQTARP